MTRKITLSIAPATETHCNVTCRIDGGMCPMLHFSGHHALCRAFDNKECTLGRADWRAQRLPECLAAEVRP